MYTIEKSISIPQLKYPFHKMEVGESVRIDKPRSSVAPILSRLQKKKNWLFQCKADGDGVRIWRVI